MPEPLPMPVSVTRVVEPPPRWTISEWAVNAPFRIVEKGALYPGPYDLGRTPYWREVLDAAGEPGVRRMNVVAPPQSGKTKLAEIILTWFLENRPTNWLYIRPAEPDIDEAFRDRFKPILEANLPGLIPARGEWVVLSKNQRIELTSAILYGAAATVPRQITSRSTPGILYDETDTGGDTGNALGNVLDLADERQMAGSAAISLTLGISSAKYDTGSNWTAYSQSSDARTYHEPCPECGHYQPLEWERFVTAGGERDPLTILAERLGRLICAGCGAEVEDRWQGWMADRGRWVPRGQAIAEPLPLDDDDIRDRRSLETLPTADPERWEPRREGPPPRNPHRGYRVWAANTKWEQRSWSHMMARWFAVARDRDPERLQVFVNSWKAEPWTEARTGADEQVVRARVGVYEPRVVPAAAKVVLGAVDIQQDSVWFSFRAFGPGMESWLIQAGSFEVHHDRYDLAMDAVYQLAFYEGWPIKGEPELRMRAYALAVDTGFKTDEAYELSRRPGVIAVKGQDIADYRVRKSEVEARVQVEPVSLYHVNNRVFKDRLQRLIKTPEDAPGGWHLPRDTTDEYINHLTAEELKPRKSNRRVLTWQKKSEGRRNEWLDTENYTLAIAEALEMKQELSLMTLGPDDPPLGVFRPGQAAAGGRRRRRRPRSRVQGLDELPTMGG